MTSRTVEQTHTEDAQPLPLQQNARSLQEQPVVIHDQDTERHANRVTRHAGAAHCG